MDVNSVLFTPNTFGFPHLKHRMSQHSREPCLSKVPQTFRNGNTYKTLLRAMEIFSKEPDLIPRQQFGKGRPVKSMNDTFPTAQCQSSEEVAALRCSFHTNWLVPLGCCSQHVLLPVVREDFQHLSSTARTQMTATYLCSPGLVFCPASPSKSYFMALRSQHLLFSILLQYWSPDALSVVLLPQETSINPS